MERTLVLLKPDALERRLVGRIIGRLEAKGLRLVGMKLLQVSRDLAERHYAEHVGKPFYQELLAFITSAPVVAIAVEGPRAIDSVRRLMGKTNPFDADPGTIRGDFGRSVTMNLVHGSDSPASAAREIPLFFATNELLNYEMADAAWLGG
ncbi:TPA: nucleoside-diphosphate kinase [Candidatus Acetothermia bacterium]|nr:nucleoside-diphosphate kinase [Candidatus Acetothermia bacterium]HAZ30988.1 nucleoside-diphosphate kinase [Candidatus Acetothermia bacterium]